MHFTEDPHLGWMIFWVVVLASASFVAFLYVRRRHLAGQEATLNPGHDDDHVLG